MTVSTAPETVTMAVPEQEKKKRGRKRAIIAFGALLGAGVLATSAAFTDFANLNLGSSGFGNTDTYNIQVVATDPETGAPIIGQWQEADVPAGVPIAITGADLLFPGSPAVTVEIPVRNASTAFNSSLALALAELEGTDANYLSSLRFDVSQPATARSATAINVQNQTFAQLSDLQLNQLEGSEESAVTISIRLLDQATSGAAFPDNLLNGKQAFLQAQFTGSSI